MPAVFRVVLRSVITQPVRQQGCKVLCCTPRNSLLVRQVSDGAPERDGHYLCLS
jgi:hypothetical protein